MWHVACATPSPNRRCRRQELQGEKDISWGSKARDEKQNQCLSLGFDSKGIGREELEGSKVTVVPHCASCNIFLTWQGAQQQGGITDTHCSCHDNAGFCHLSCMIEYAQQMSKQVGDPCICGHPNCAEAVNNLSSAFITPGGCAQTASNRSKIRLGLICHLFVSFADAADGYALAM